MNIQQVNKDMTVKELLDLWPETLDVLVANGFENLKDPKVLASVGGFLKLERAALTKNYDLDNFLGLLQQKIDEKRNLVDVTMKSTENATSEIRIAGLLPCPVRLPLLEGFDSFIEGYTKDTGVSVSYKLEAASVGADWIKENIQGIDAASELPDLFISAGFETFFDPQTIGRFKEQGAFSDLTPTTINSDFDGITMKDPKGHYGLISVVPAVFMVNLDELGDLPVPRSWSDLLKPEYERNVALPVGDFDLFNAILLAIHQEHGDEGVRKLGRCMLKSMHPSQMIKNAQRVAEEKPLVTIMPYFFSRMAAMAKSLEIVWPEDGAIISPIFMLTKTEKQDKLQPIADFLASKAVGEILAHKGLFPSLHAEVDNRLPTKHPWKWVGWDYIYANDIAAMIRHTTALFEESMNAV